MGQQPAFYVVHLSVHTTRELIIDQQLPRNILYLPVTVAGVKYLRIRVTRRQSRIFDGHCTRPLATISVTGHLRILSYSHSYDSFLDGLSIHLVEDPERLKEVAGPGQGAHQVPGVRGTRPKQLNRIG